MQLDIVQWQPMWTTLLGCTKGCLDYLGFEVSTPWLFGTTGHAFLLNFGEDTCASHPTAWDRTRLQQLGENLGFQSTEIKGFDGELSAQQELAWNACRQSIDSGRPCLAWAMDIPEWYIVSGYDEVGYLYVGVQADKGAGPRPWREYDWLHLVTLTSCQPSEPSKTMKDALEYVLELDAYPTKWTFETRRTGLAAYDNWINAAQALPDLDHPGHGMAFNAAVWAECRKNAVAFLKEAKQKLSGRCDQAFDDAISHYETVAQRLNKTAQLFPFSPPDWDKNARNAQLLGIITNELATARQAEEKGLAALKDIAAKL